MEDLISKILNVEDISSFLKSFFIALLLSPILLILYLFRKRFLFGYARLNNWFEKKYEFYKKSLSAHEGLIFKFLTFSFKAILGSAIFAGVIQFWMIIFLLFGIIFSIYIGRFLYKYIISNLFTNLKLSRQRTVVAKLLIHKYYLRDYNIFHWLQQMLSLENFDNSFHEKLEKTIDNFGGFANEERLVSVYIPTKKQDLKEMNSLFSFTGNRDIIRYDWSNNLFCIQFNSCL